MNNNELDKLKETLKEYADYAVKLVKENKIKDKEIERLNTEIDYLNKLRDEDAEELKKKDNIINELVLSCYGSDMSLAEFENIWEIAFNKKYNPKEIDKLKELKENKDE